MQCNPLTVCRRFDDDEDQPPIPEEGDEGQRDYAPEEDAPLVLEETIERKPKRAALVDRDINTASQVIRPGGRVKA